MADWLMAGWLLSPPRLARGAVPVETACCRVPGWELCDFGLPGRGILVAVTVGLHGNRIPGFTLGIWRLSAQCVTGLSHGERILLRFRLSGEVICPRCDCVVVWRASVAVIWPTDWDICLPCDWAAARRPGIAVIRLVGPLSPPDTAPLSRRPATASPATPQSSATTGRSSSPPKMRSSLR